MPDDTAQNTQPLAPDSTTLASAGIMALSRGIARGEGAYVSGSLPQRSNNPGDLTKSFGFNTTGVANKEGVLIFETMEDGWNALYSQIRLIFNSKSKVFSTNMTIWDFASMWTLGRAPQTAGERASVGGWVTSVLQELNGDTAVVNSGALSAQSTLGDISV